MILRVATFYSPTSLWQRSPTLAFQSLHLKKGLLMCQPWLKEQPVTWIPSKCSFTICRTALIIWRETSCLIFTHIDPCFEWVVVQMFRVSWHLKEICVFNVVEAMKMTWNEFVLADIGRRIHWQIGVMCIVLVWFCWSLYAVEHPLTTPFRTGAIGTSMTWYVHLLPNHVYNVKNRKKLLNVLAGPSMAVISNLVFQYYILSYNIPLCS